MAMEPIPFILQPVKEKPGCQGTGAPVVVIENVYLFIEGDGKLNPTLVECGGLSKPFCKSDKLLTTYRFRTDR